MCSVEGRVVYFIHLKCLSLSACGQAKNLRRGMRETTPYRMQCHCVMQCYLVEF